MAPRTATKAAASGSATVVLPAQSSAIAAAVVPVSAGALPGGLPGSTTAAKPTKAARARKTSATATPKAARAPAAKKAASVAGKGAKASSDKPKKTKEPKFASEPSKAQAARSNIVPASTNAQAVIETYTLETIKAALFKLFAGSRTGITAEAFARAFGESNVVRTTKDLRNFGEWVDGSEAEGEGGDGDNGDETQEDGDAGYDDDGVE